MEILTHIIYDYTTKKLYIVIDDENKQIMHKSVREYDIEEVKKMLCTVVDSKKHGYYYFDMRLSETEDNRKGAALSDTPHI